MALSLIVGAPGSLLSHAGRSLAERGDVAVMDVERQLLSSLSPSDEKAVRAHAPGTEPLTMSAFARSFPRAKALHLWSESFERALRKVDPSTPTALVCHLTLYRRDRSEFFSTAGQVVRALTANGTRVNSVVQLIDDVYDMYGRLSSPVGALNAESSARRWLAFTEKSTPRALWASLSRGDGETQHVELETRVQTMNLLLAWRHNESLSAESVAAALDARFTALGVKHSFEALRRLAGSAVDVTRTVYISHPISAYRREVNAKLSEGATSDLWADGVSQCNALPELMQQGSSLVAIMPTAIDELRFRGLENTASRLTERSPILGPRWPLMNGGRGLIASPANGGPLKDSDVQHAAVLLPEDSPIRDQQFTGELTRFIEGAIYSEIPYRDHLIVANTDAFFVHRPYADQARLSSGVEHEVRHWRDRNRWEDAPSRLAIFHAEAELRLLRERWQGASWIKSQSEQAAERARTLEGIEANAQSFLSSRYELESSDARRVLSGKPIDFAHLGGRDEFSTSESVHKARKDAIFHGLEGLLLDRLTLVSGMQMPGVGIFFDDEADELDQTKMDLVNRFLEHPDSTPLQIWDLGHAAAASSPPSEGSCKAEDLLCVAPVMRALFDEDVESADERTAAVLGRRPTWTERLQGRREAAFQGAWIFFESLRSEPSSG